MTPDKARQTGEAAGLTLYTVGHSTRTMAEFESLMLGNGIRSLVDIRTIPKSRRNPQYSQEALAASLSSAGLSYLHMPALGGLRKPTGGDENSGWRNASFRGFADYMQTPLFSEALERLLSIATASATVIMCAEAVPWRCHRSLVSDPASVRGVRVLHIIGLSKPRPHTMTKFARVDGAKVTYPAAPSGQ
jgi:uncharacterized protein (DUF488 family)